VAESKVPIEKVGLLEDYSFLASKLSVYVLSLDGWSWAVAWAQLGVRSVKCVALSAPAAVQLDELVGVPSMGARLVKSSVPVFGSSKQGVAMCVHATGQQVKAWPREWDALRKLLDVWREASVQLVTMSGAKDFQADTRKWFGARRAWQKMRHRHLGGLTTAYVFLGWREPGLETELTEPGKRRNPIRPLDRFLEPSTKLSKWKRATAVASCWAPCRANASAFPVPWSADEPWVEAPTCLLAKRDFQAGDDGPILIQRPLTLKERGQLMDVREDWGAALVPLMWAWDAGGAPPLRLLVESAMALMGCFRCHAEPVAIVEERTLKTLKESFDWGRVRAPWLGGSPDSRELERMAYFGWVWEAEDADTVVATRSDDAEVDLSLWSVGGEEEGMERHRESLRKFLFKYYLRRTCREAREWLRSDEAKAELSANREEIRDCVQRLANSTWWDWADGSRLLFWRWPANWRGEARDGSRGFHTGIPPPRMNYPQPPMQEAWIVEKDEEKLAKLVRRRYLGLGPCRNAVPRFAVPKGTTDIRVVWDLKKNGLNEHMYTPGFFLPTMGTYLRRLPPGSYSGDFDIGEQFHNYMLHESERVFCGVHVPTRLVECLRAEGLQVAPLMRWERLVFGWQSSPYLALRMLARALELARGHPLDLDSAFCFDAVQLNLPGAPGYDPGRLRVTKVRRDGTAAADLVAYCDDGRTFAPEEGLAIQATRQVTSGLQALGNQEAARKRRKPSQRAGAWAGGIAYTDQRITRKFVSTQKWRRAKEFVEWLGVCLNGEEVMTRARFRSGKGFLLYIAQTYDSMQPHLKGLHLAEEAWRPNRDVNGWKHGSGEGDAEGSDSESESDELGAKFGLQKATNEEAPDVIPKLPRLVQDVKALRGFFARDTPVHVIVHPVQGAFYVAYGAGDASGEGFGSSIHPLGLPPLLRHGFWCTEASEQSSNWREFRNLVDAVKLEAESGRLVGCELWLATDNSTAVAAYHKGTTSSEKLQDMVTELRNLTITGNFVLNVFHIAGTRMIQIGVDGLSRGEMQLGALASTPTSAAPLHLSALERSPALLGWLHEWLGFNSNIAKPEDWFYAAQQAGSEDGHREYWVWDLPPAAALYALEELGGARIKRHEILQGVVLVPGLLAHEWRRRLSRITDFHFTIPAGSIPQWPADMFEPLTVAVYLPLFRCQPWDWKRVPFVVPLGIALSKMHKESPASSRALLRQFWSATKQVPIVRQSVLRIVLQERLWFRFLGLSTTR
jgi:hypothetical protein